MRVFFLLLYYPGVSQPNTFFLSVRCMEALFLLFYELTKFTGRLDDFQITKKSGVVNRNELSSIQLVISNPTVALSETALIPTILLGSGKKNKENP